MWPMALGICERLSAESMWPMALGVCERLSAESCRPCGQWPWVSVNVFPLSHVDHVANGPGYL